MPSQTTILAPLPLVAPALVREAEAEAVKISAESENPDVEPFEVILRAFPPSLARRAWHSTPKLNMAILDLLGAITTADHVEAVISIVAAAAEESAGDGAIRLARIYAGAVIRRRRELGLT